MTTKIKTFTGLVYEVDRMIENWMEQQKDRYVANIEIIHTSESMVMDSGLAVLHVTIVYKDPTG